MDKTLSYKNDDHKNYGAAGMAISLVIFDGEPMLSAVSIDAAPGEMMEMSDEFFFAGNPSLSAKASWSRIVNNFNLTAAMAIGNVLCRSMVLEQKPVTDECRRALHDYVMEEAKLSCSLEEDEAETLFERNYKYLSRVFNHHGVWDITRDFVDKLVKYRRMSRAEVIDALHAITML